MKAVLVVLLISISTIYSDNTIEVNPFDTNTLTPIEKDKLLSCAEIISSKVQVDSVIHN
jgi:hypothetical protein